jgi:NADH:ubiquinone oxidoreductase subunit 2 (subunit N)
MTTFQKIIQYAYLFIAVFFGYETYRTWNEDRSRAYMLLVFALLAVFMYFFKKHFRKKMEDRNQ